MTRATRSGLVTLATLILFLLASGLATLHHHSDDSDDLDCPACLWTQAAGGVQLSEAPVIMMPGATTCHTIEINESILPQGIPGIIPPRSPPALLS